MPTVGPWLCFSSKGKATESLLEGASTDTVVSMNLTQVTERETCDVSTEGRPFLYGGEPEEEEEWEDGEEDTSGALPVLP